jgi:ABC transporter transmembrane region
VRHPSSTRLLSRSCYPFRRWSATALEDNESPAFFIAVYAIINAVGLCIGTIRWSVLYNGSIRASTVLYKQLLETILFTDIRFHDTVSRGRLLNRFGKDFEGQLSLFLTDPAYSQYIAGIDSSLAEDFGKMIYNALSALTTIVTVSVVGGLPFLLMVSLLGVVYYSGERGTTSLRLLLSHKPFSGQGLQSSLSRYKATWCALRSISRSLVLMHCIRLCYSLAVVLHLWRNYCRGSHPPCVWGIV